MDLFKKIIVGSLLLYLGKKVTEATRFGSSVHHTNNYTASGISNAVYSELHAKEISLDFYANILVKDLKANSIQLKFKSKIVAEQFSLLKVNEDDNASNRHEAQLNEGSTCTVTSKLDNCDLVLKGVSEFTVLGDLNNCKVTMDSGAKLTVSGTISSNTTIEFGEAIQNQGIPSSNPVVYCDKFDEGFSKENKIQFALVSQNLSRHYPIDFNYIVYSGLPFAWNYSVSSIRYCYETAKLYKDKIDPKVLEPYTSSFKTLPLINRCFGMQEKNNQSL